MNPTLIEIKHALFAFFSQESILNPEKQADLVKFACDDKDLKTGLVVEGLKELEKLEIVRKVTTKTGDFWVLIKPLAMYERTIYCGYDTLIALATCINKFLEEGGNTKDFVDATDIKERDIQTLVLIAESFLQKTDKTN